MKNARANNEKNVFFSRSFGLLKQLSVCYFCVRVNTFFCLYYLLIWNNSVYQFQSIIFCSNKQANKYHFKWVWKERRIARAIRDAIDWCVNMYSLNNRFSDRKSVCCGRVCQIRFIHLIRRLNGYVCTTVVSRNNRNHMRLIRFMWRKEKAVAERKKENMRSVERTNAKLEKINSVGIARFD